MTDPEDALQHTEKLLDHSDWLSSLARHLVHDPADAEDLVQETWAAALASAPEDASRHRPWLGRVVRNFAALAFRRKERRVARERVVAREESVQGPEETIQRLEIFRRVVEHVLALDPSSRDVITLRYFEGLSGAEIARRLGLEPSTVRMRLKRALDELRKRLDAEHDGDRSAWHACLLFLSPSVARMPPVGASATAVGAKSAVPAFLAGAAAALILGATFLGGWSARAVVWGPAESTGQAHSTDLWSSPRGAEIRDRLHEVLEKGESRRAELEDLHGRLGALEEIVESALRGNPA